MNGFLWGMVVAFIGFNVGNYMAVSNAKDRIVKQCTAGKGFEMKGIKFNCSAK